MKLHDNDLENCYFCPWRVVSENEGKVVIFWTFDFQEAYDMDHGMSHGPCLNFKLTNKK